MSRFFVNESSVNLRDGTITITGEDVKHIGNVLRTVPGDALEISDGAGTDYDVVVERISRESVLTKITGSRPNLAEPPVDVILYQGIPKADKMDYIIQKCTELGVKRIVPVITARTVVKFGNARDTGLKLTRWRRIALEAAKQCGRGVVPEVGEPVGFEEAVKQAENCDLKLLPYEEESRGSLRKQLRDFKTAGANRKIAVFIGAEGGFEPLEAEKAVRSGFASVTLGPRILRTETAGMAVIAVIMYEVGDVGQN